MKIYIQFLLLMVSSMAMAQTKPVTGFIFKSLEIGDNSRMDFFLGAELDTTKSLEDNLIKLKNDTLVRINLTNVDISDTFIIKYAGKLINILPVKVIWSDWTIKDSFLHSQEFINFPILVTNQTIVDGYNPKLIRSFKKLTIVELTNDSTKEGN